MSNGAYNPRGDCKYCSSCDGSVCTCQSSAWCESFLPKVAAIVCISLGLLLLVLGVRSFWRWLKRNLVRVRPDELPELQSKPEMKLHVWERSAAVAIGLPLCGAVLFLAMGVVVWVTPATLG
ncbi:unnamed protein product [Effrenium voratum]|nr:unnamed protein product [Effrenium voratum]